MDDFLGNYGKFNEAVTSANAVDIAKEILFSLDPRLRSQELLMFCSQDFADKYNEAYLMSHGGIPYNTQYNHTTVEGSNGRLKLVPLYNKADSKFIHICPKSNMLVGTNKTLKLWAFISQVIERTYLADNHSKILLVKSNAGDTVSPSGQQLGHSAVDEQAPDCSRCTTVCVVTSQNLTQGNRSESAFITTDKEIFATLHSQVDDLISNHSVPLNDLFTQRISSDKP